jgi:hypothetical protein
MRHLPIPINLDNGVHLSAKICFEPPTWQLRNQIPLLTKIIKSMDISIIISLYIYPENVSNKSYWL